LKSTVEAWHTLIKFKEEGKVRKIGISNIYDVESLRSLEDASGVRVDVVQNRWYEGNGWDRDVLKWCKDNGVMYQCVELSTSWLKALTWRTSGRSGRCPVLPGCYPTRQYYP
jgi:hypothetical protein